MTIMIFAVFAAFIVFGACAFGVLGFIFGLLAYKKASGLEKRVESLESSNEK